MRRIFCGILSKVLPICYPYVLFFMLLAYDRNVSEHLKGKEADEWLAEHIMSSILHCCWC